MSPGPRPILLPHFLLANGQEFALIELLPQAVPGGSPVSEAPLVVCLHGFPDSLWSYSDLLPRLAAAGYRAVSVSMRGYLPGALPVQAEYGISVLARDVIALIDHLGAQQAVVIGHDWGAVAA